MPSIVALALGTWAGAVPADAHAPFLPAGILLCFRRTVLPRPAPIYPPLIYDVAAPV